MGCGKSKHDVASGNTVLQRKKSSVGSKENGIETKDTNNNNFDNIVSSDMTVEQKNDSENVEEFGGEVKDDVVINDVKGEAEETNMQEEKEAKKTDVQEDQGETQETIAEEGHSEKSEGEKDYSFKENEQKSDDAETTSAAEEEKMATENEIKDVNVKDEEVKDTEVSTSESEEKYL